MNKPGNKIKIVVDQDIPFLRGALEGAARVDYLPGTQIDRKSLMAADALITRTRTKCDGSLLGGTQIRFIATASIGYDHIDTAYCDAAGIKWTNAPGCNSGSVEQYILSVLLGVAGRFDYSLEDRCIGIIGVGNVGSKVERISRVMGMRVLLNDPPRARSEGPEDFVDINRILQEADFVTLHVPLHKEGTDRTWHLVDDQFLAGMQGHAVLINSSRGEVVDGTALKKALKQSGIRAAVLDVWEGEPEIDRELLDLVDIGTPHIAGYSIDGKANATTMSVRALSRFFGLGLDDWSPEGLPVTGNDNYILDASRFDLQDLLLLIATKAYPVMRDDAALRRDPSRFEELRANYPVRREPEAIRVNLINDHAGAGPVLKKLGYHFRSDHC